MSDIVDMLDSSSANDSINLNLDDDNDESNETPFQRLLRLHASHSNYNDRKNAVKYILDALRFVTDVDSLYEILSCTKKLADDIVTQVQIDSLEKFVGIIEYLVQNVENADILIREYLFQSIIQTIGHTNNRIRKSSQSALIRLFEYEQVKSEDIEEEIIPALCQLDRACDDFKNESILLMTRLTAFVSTDLILKYFVPTIVQQSSSIAFQTRKTCATSLGDLTTVLPPSAVDQYLVPCLANLSSDPFWGVRKSCAEVIHPLGQVCSNESRWNVLSPCLIQLLQDQSRWVKTAALRVLGYFISTFARSKPNDDEEDENAGHGETENENEAGREKGSGETKDAGSLSDQLNELVSLNDNEQFNDFNYWRDPIDHRIEFDEETKIQFETNSSQSPLQFSRRFSRHDIQSLLPSELLEFYTNLIEQSYSSGVETDIVHQGAHTFPAVALTLTHHNWHHIRDLHRKLSEDLQWKVRRTLAYSLHVLAEMLTVEQVEEDLCPVFESFLRDVDEVKIGILSHLSQFLQVLSASTRRTYLDKLTYLTTVDNQRNWRFRWESANQLYELTWLFPSSDVADYLTPLALAMSIDRVAEVRRVAIKALSACYRKYSSEESDTAMEVFLDDCYRTFASSDDWKLRQCYIHLCQAIFDLHVDSGDQYALRFLVHLLALKDDPVVNVRLSLGQFLFDHLLHIDLSDDWRTQLDQCLQSLLVDKDRDVRSAVGGIYQSRGISLSADQLLSDCHASNELFFSSNSSSSTSSSDQQSINLALT